MNQYITGSAIKRLRELKGLTQNDLANILSVSDKAISKWETGKCYPDITLLEPISKALGVSITELLQGEEIINNNVSGNMLRSKIYVCPICGNIIHVTGDVQMSCCGLSLSPLECEEMDEMHSPTFEKVEDETFISLNHDMTKEHYISFMAYVTGDKFDLVKLYPEENCETRFKIRGMGYIYLYCNKHGLYKIKTIR